MYHWSMPPLRRFQNLPPERRAEILRAAAAEIGVHGLEGTSLNRVIARAGISKSSFYYYFADKDDLYGALVTASLTRLLDAMGTPAPAADPEEYWQGWRRMCHSFLHCQIEDPVLARLSWNAIQARTEGGAHPALAQAAQRLSIWLEKVLRQGQELGAVRSDLASDLLLHASFGMLEGADRWLAERWGDLKDAPIEETSAAIVALLRSLVSRHRSKGEEG